ncbi:hypothetical protein [Mucilaginibacter phyllosphaerae]|uniref:Di/tricarboxylate transporter n=1 Tax=Mucilaginibacter phyllosphaerae TaxID=1812349 RepID=A0A4Y8AHP8_9SPHI|nr:hypothetical protein [Mucilaginibacter phyllosphaerae]MBB3971341.1 di/tricarboxylate transporter [Mucilaginibacter phyllosphaerae]TEW68606.1 hypothetical protein E2R65_00105 [Mucilaginibacter phyllosphaerae]GGH24059.1 hypothetical protein GCM10007352_38340 [Mucilaginibacter phyllosphaerae]
MKKRVIVNIIVVFIIPAIALIHQFITIEILNDHSRFPEGWLEFVKEEALTTFLGIPLFLLTLNTLYNIIILKIGIFKLSYLKKALIFLSIPVILICLLGTFSNVWIYPYWKNIYYIACFAPYTFLVAGIIHWFVDRKEIKLNLRH